MNEVESGASMSTYGQRLEASSESMVSLLSRRGSEFGNRYVQIDDSGIYLSSLAVTILLSSVATIGILLFTLVVTLSVMLSSCQTRPMLPLRSSSQGSSEILRIQDGNRCESFRVNAETNNLQGWMVPRDCSSYVASYMLQGQYIMDFDTAIAAAKSYFANIVAANDAIVFDIDDTVLSNIDYYSKHDFGVEPFNETAWDGWVDQARAPPLKSILSLYQQLQAANWSMIFITGRPERQRSKTVENLIKAGYSGWVSLHLRSPNEERTTAVSYKSRRRMHLETKGYRIRASIGDQWSDLVGPASGTRTFKLPNPMYYVF